MVDRERMNAVLGSNGCETRMAELPWVEEGEMGVKDKPSFSER